MRSYTNYYPAPHLYEFLWRHYFRMRDIVTLLSPVYFVLFAGRRDPSRTVTPFGDPLWIGRIGHVWRTCMMSRDIFCPKDAYNYSPVEAMHYTAHMVVQCVKLTTRKLIRSTRVCSADHTIPLVCAITLHASLATLDSFIFHSETTGRLGKVKYISSTWFFS